MVGVLWYWQLLLEQIRAAEAAAEAAVAAAATAVSVQWLCGRDTS
jgi:hypothetical protein